MIIIFIIWYFQSGVSDKYHELCMIKMPLNRVLSRYSGVVLVIHYTIVLCLFHSESYHISMLDDGLTRQGVSAHTDCERHFTSFCGIFVG